jgi:hypothetical protein
VLIQVALRLEKATSGKNSILSTFARNFPCGFVVSTVIAARKSNFDLPVEYWIFVSYARSILLTRQH